MKILNAGCPRADGFYMPAEYAPHKGTITIWPKRPGSWIYGAGRAREAFAEVICAISESEQVYVLAEADVIDNARVFLQARMILRGSGCTGCRDARRKRSDQIPERRWM